MHDKEMNNTKNKITLAIVQFSQFIQMLLINYYLNLPNKQ